MVPLLYRTDGKTEALPRRRASVWVQLQVSVSVMSQPVTDSPTPPTRPLRNASPPGALFCGPPRGGSSGDSSSVQAHWPHSVRRGHSQPPLPSWGSQACNPPVRPGKNGAGRREPGDWLVGPGPQPQLATGQRPRK